MKYLKLFENFEPMSREEMFGKQTNLEKQFSDIVVKGLIGDDKEFWSTFNALKIEIKDVIGKEDSLFQELMYRITDDQDPVKVMSDICEEVTNPEIERLLKKLAMLDPNPLYREYDEYSDDEEMERFDEAIVDYNNPEIDALMDEIKNSNKRVFSIIELSDMAEPHNIEIVNYDTFYNELPERDKKTAPPKNAQFFALVNPVTKKPRVVFNMGPMVPKDFFIQVPIGDILKHEQIHIGQYSRRPMDTPLPEPKDQKEYFSNKDEVMAFAFSLAKEIISEYPDIKTPNEGIVKLTTPEVVNKNIRSFGPPKEKFRLYNNIKKNVDRKTLNRYNKYIYLYLEDLLKKEE